MKIQPSCQKRRHAPVVIAAGLLLTALLGHPARAAEESGWACLGFSNTGSHVGVEVFGVHEDGRSAYSSIRVIDTRANRFVVPPITTCIGKGCEDPIDSPPTAKEARRRNHQKARATLAQFGIGANLLGDRISFSARSRTAANPGAGAGEMALETAQFPWLGAQNSLVLREVPARGAGEGGTRAPRMIDLRLQRSGAELILQKDESIPKSRGAGIYAYELEAVIGYKTSLLVVLRYSRPGQRGADISPLFVTGEIGP